MEIADALRVPTVHVQFADDRGAELPGQARCLPVPEAMDRRLAALTQDEEGRALVYPHVSGGYYPYSTGNARHLADAPAGAEVLVEMKGEGIWRAAKVEPAPGFLCPVHKVPMRLDVPTPRGLRLGCQRCETERAVEAIGSGIAILLPGEQTPGIHAVTGYAWSIRPLDEAARQVAAGGAEGMRYGYQAGEVEPAHDAEWLCDWPSLRFGGCSDVEHLVVTPTAQAPTVPRGWGIEPVRPLRARMLNDDPARPVFSVKSAGPVETVCDWTIQSWTYGVGT